MKRASSMSILSGMNPGPDGQQTVTFDSQDFFLFVATNKVPIVGLFSIVVCEGGMIRLLKRILLKISYFFLEQLCVSKMKNALGSIISVYF